MKEALIVFVRNHLSGQVKTRLARGIGPDRAVETYLRLMQHTRETVLTLSCDHFVFYDGEIDEQDIWSEEHFHKRRQTGDDLGLRMRNAINSCLDVGYSAVVLIGSDIWDLSPEVLREAFEALTRSDIVIGPAADGGYYLIGVKRPQDWLFDGMNWGQDGVFQTTMVKIRRAGAAATVLRKLHDMDTAEDYYASDLWRKAAGHAQDGSSGAP
jgi:rSAM/selenodomain-associated transferase 1